MIDRAQIIPELYMAGSIGKHLFRWLREHIPEGSIILELGSGYGTALLAHFYKMHSIEDSAEWVNRFDSSYIHAPIVNEWYDLSALIDLPVEYDVLLIDGPAGTVRRCQFVYYLDLFRSDVVFIFDDVDRPGEKEMFEKICAILKRAGTIYPDGHKNFGVITKLSGVDICQDMLL